MESVNFDRAAGYYDQTRRDSPQTLARVVSLLEHELAGRGPCLEIGVGTGRLGIPLAASGVPLVGVDISSRMLARLVEKAGGAPFPVALGDATCLPFAGASFGAAVASHVLHLVPGWREAVAELLRVVRPGGVVLVELTGGWPQPFRDVQRRFAEAGALDRLYLGVWDAAELDAAFGEAGASIRELPKVVEESEITLQELIDRFEHGEFSYTWRMDEQARRRGAEEARALVRERYGSLDAPHRLTRTISWRAYDLPG